MSEVRGPKECGDQNHLRINDPVPFLADSTSTEVGMTPNGAPPPYPPSGRQTTNAGQRKPAYSGWRAMKQTFTVPIAALSFLKPATGKAVTNSHPSLAAALRSLIPVVIVSSLTMPPMQDQLYFHTVVEAPARCGSLGNFLA